MAGPAVFAAAAVDAAVAASATAEVGGGVATLAGAAAGSIATSAGVSSTVVGGVGIGAIAIGSGASLFSGRIADYIGNVAGAASGMAGESGGRYEGGAYRDLKDPITGRNVPGQEINHIPPDSVTNGYGISSRNKPAIQMDTADHLRTASWGSSRAAQQWRSRQAAYLARGDVDTAVRMDYDDVNAKFPGKYTNAINQHSNSTAMANLRAAVQQSISRGKIQ